MKQPWHDYRWAARRRLLFGTAVLVLGAAAVVAAAPAPVADSRPTAFVVRGARVFDGTRSLGTTDSSDDR